MKQSCPPDGVCNLQLHLLSSYDVVSIFALNDVLISNVAIAT